MGRAGRWVRRIVVIATVVGVILGVREALFRAHAREAATHGDEGHG